MPKTVPVPKVTLLKTLETSLGWNSPVPVPACTTSVLPVLFTEIWPPAK